MENEIILSYGGKKFDEDWNPFLLIPYWWCLLVGNSLISYINTTQCLYVNFGAPFVTQNFVHASFIILSEFGALSFPFEYIIWFMFFHFPQGTIKSSSILHNNRKQISFFLYKTFIMYYRPAICYGKKKSPGMKSEFPKGLKKKRSQNYN